MTIKTQSLVDLFKAGTDVALWVAPVGESEPADTVGIGTAWGGNWESLGWTKEGIKLIHNQTKANFNIQQSTMAVDSRVIEETMRGETMLALSDPSRLAVVLGRASSAATDTAAGAGQPGKTELTLQANVTDEQKYALGVEANHYDASGNELPVRVFFLRVSLEPNGDLMTFDTKNDDYSGVPLAWNAFADVGNTMQFVKYQYITAPATA